MGDAGKENNDSNWSDYYLNFGKETMSIFFHVFSFSSHCLYCL